MSSRSGIFGEFHRKPHKIETVAMSVADLRRREGRATPWVTKFFQFHAVFGKIWENRMLAPPPGEIMDPPLNVFLKLVHNVGSSDLVF